jgi:hypothetical protein
MAKFLIYNKVHWYDLPSKSEPEKTGYERHQGLIDDLLIPEIEKVGKHLKLNQEYESISIRGDIVEVRPDSMWLTEKEKESYVLIQVVELSYEEAKSYVDRVMDGTRIKRKFKYNIDITGLVFDGNNEATISLQQATALITEKS